MPHISLWSILIGIVGSISLVRLLPSLDSKLCLSSPHTDLGGRDTDEGHPRSLLEVAMRRFVMLSVIVPTLIRQQSLRRTIQSLRGQTLPADQFEILVVDNGSTDDTLMLVEELDRSVGKQIQLLREPCLGLHNARHAGARAAKGDILVFTDDDATFDPDWLRAYADTFECHPEMVAAGGPVRPLWEVPPPEWVVKFMGDSREFGILSLMEPYEDFRLDTNGYFYGVNMAIRRSVLFAVGGFNPESFGEVWLGDGESGLNCKLWARSMSIGYIPNAIVYHHIPAERMTVSYFRRRMANQGACDFYTRLNHHVPSRFELLRNACTILLSNSKLWLKAYMLKGRTEVPSLQLQLRAAQRLAEVKYIIRLIIDRRLRALVRQTAWL